MEEGITAIGYVTDSRDDRRDDGWGRQLATIVLDDRFGTDALLGLDEFSHVEVVFRFHGLTDDDVTTGARHPRENPDWPLVGIFAQRASKRPNRLAVTVCHLVGVDGTEHPGARSRRDRRHAGARHQAGVARRSCRAARSSSRRGSAS